MCWRTPSARRIGALSGLLLAMCFGAPLPVAARTGVAETGARRVRAEGLLRRCRPIDLHSDALLQLRRRKSITGCAERAGLRTTVAGLLKSHYGGQVLALFAKPGRGSGGRALTAALRAYDRWTKACPSLNASPAVALAGEASEGLIHAVLAVEGAGIIGDHPDALARLARRGLFSIAPVWNTSNRWADGVGGPVLHRGLSEAGRKLVDAAGALGVLIDISHAADRSVAGILARSRLPVVATHSNARAIHGHRRNLTDQQIRAIARSGGVIGVNFHCGFIVPRGRSCDVAALIRHVRHIYTVGGRGILALGSDFDGHITPPRDLRHAGQLLNLVQGLLVDGLPQEAICGMLGDNVRRLLRGRGGKSVGVGGAGHR